MPVSSGHGRWPTEYGVGIKDERIAPKCAICTQKNCFICEHNLSVRNAIFSNKPYLDPKEDYSIADRNSQKRREEDQRRNNQQVSKSKGSKATPRSKDSKKNKINPEDSGSKEKKSRCTIL
ncbi:hypothetical protein BpHYR1_029826 [Brachionus plicatilis]|uniref:Uncharacterized protein n=1 Tax=Brachionus plicatilis TaxID=10195 RepID=A0A3M7S8V9_BRAPC|nr:hypothetical protein BpHYR1_029826 [Brachionus plicatilis]